MKDKSVVLRLLSLCLISLLLILSLFHTSYSENIVIAPLKQIKNGISVQNVTCAGDLILVFKISDGSPACVTNATADMLFVRQSHTQISEINVFVKYKILSWHDVPEKYNDNIVRMIWVDTDSDPVQVAMKSHEKPEGYAALFLWKFTWDLYSNSKDRCIDPITNEYTNFMCPWLDNGIADMKQKIFLWFTEYKHAGGKLDYLIMDDEFSFSNWSLNEKSGWYNAIAEDPRFGTLIPRIHQTSFDLVMNRPHTNHPAYLQWNAIQDEMLVDARNEAIFKPIQELYPDVKATNYDDYFVLKDVVVPEKNGHKQYYFTNFGTHNSKAFYGDLGQYEKMIGGNSSQVLEWELSVFDAIKKSSDIPNMMWVSYFSYGKNDLNQQDYETLMLYLICNTGEPLLFWNPNATDEDNQIMDGIVSKVNDENYCKRYM